ncbi:MAG: hypothetical protein Q4C25_06165, partial [Bacillota bacterium]|nr:hypothetical protein [Bacillota bacterium]
QQLCDLYEKNIEQMEGAYESELNELKDKYQKYDDNNELYVSLIMEAKKSSNDIINQAKEEVESILAEGRERVAQQERELEQMRAAMEAERQMISDELNAARQAVEAEKAAMKAEVDAEKEKMMALKGKYNQQINSMEEEFVEIKTNILRTAGRIDSLKSKLPEADEIKWDLSSDVDADVDFPAPEIAVEEPVVAADTYIPDPVQQVQEAPVTELVQEAVAVEEQVPEEAAAEEPVQEISLEDLIPSEDPVQTMGDEIPEINFDDIEIDLPELTEEAAPERADDTEEISFEGLEELFKEEEKQ